VFREKPAVSLRPIGIFCCFVSFTLLALKAEAQTSCSVRHPGTGAFICYPNPTEDPADSNLPVLFHLSAQGNAPSGKAITRYTVRMDDRMIYDNRLPLPLQNLSIETNLMSPFDSGTHSLQLVIEGAGSAEMKGLHVYISKSTSFCDPFSRVDRRACNISKIRDKLQWFPNATPKKTPPEPLEGYFGYLELYGQNLKRVEADVSDAIAVDGQGSLYAATHAFSDVELRKYTPNGSMVFNSLIRSCGDGILSVSGLAIDDAGHAWIAGNTSACLTTTSGAFQSHVSDDKRTRGFVALVDTTKPSSAGPLYVTYLSGVDYRITAIRADAEGNAYVTGTTESLEFPHQALLNVDDNSAQSQGTRFGFISVLDPAGSSLAWSTLLRDAKLTALALDSAKNVYVTGGVAARQSSERSCAAVGKTTTACDDVLVAKVSDSGKQLTYVAQFGEPGNQEGRAISISAKSPWILTAGDTDREGSRSFLTVLQPCKTGIVYSSFVSDDVTSATPDIAVGPALDGFSSALSGTAIAGVPGTGQKSAASIRIAPVCP
jgi:hypothetical protein